ncbi:hypothetical protein LQV05_004164 [Cryptococcus neoformans]|nr:hypothetical protein LQV05_004164 [Cryptococcus neoformans]
MSSSFTSSNVRRSLSKHLLCRISFDNINQLASVEQKLLNIAYSHAGLIPKRDPMHHSLAKVRTIHGDIPKGYIVTSISRDPFSYIGLSIQVAVRLPVSVTTSYKDIKDCYVLEQTLIRIAWDAALLKLENGKSPRKAVKNAKKVLVQAIKSIQRMIGTAEYFRFAHAHYDKVPTYRAVVYTLKKPPMAERWVGRLEKKRVKFMKSLECASGAFARDQWTREQMDFSIKLIDYHKMENRSFRW